MKNYRLVEAAPINGQRNGKKERTTVFCGPDKAEMKKAIETWCASPRKPYADIRYYYGSKLIYAYEL